MPEDQEQQVTLEALNQGDYHIAQLRKQQEQEDAANWHSKACQLQKDDFLCSHCMQCYRGWLGEQFPPECNMSYPMQMRDEREHPGYAGLSAEQKDQLEAVSDPVSWAKLMFDWDARDFQRELLQCSAQRRVVRAGRRVGKSECMAVMILYFMYLKPNKSQDPLDEYEIIVVCPYEYQVGVLFDKMRRMLYRSPYLRSMVDKELGGNDRREPQQLVFYTGAKCTGFTASVRTGGKANKVRGQDANGLFIDEMDYLDRESIESMMALYASDRNCVVWASSTPSGRRENFYEWVTDKRLGFKEFHYPSSVSPEWSAKTELFYRSVYSRMGYLHEFEAEFGESETAVFHASDIEKSLEVYDMRFCQPQENCIYTIGVDWNTVAFGTHIVVTEYSFKTHKMKMVHKEIIDAAEFTQKIGVERVIALNDIWNPTYIYVDQGYGAMQIETLHEEGIRNPSSGLRRKVKGIDMGGRSIVRDPASGQEIKKPTKAFLVDIAARRVEVGQCILPKNEDHKQGMIWQMRNYEVIGVGETGQPKFTKEKDHTLVAWMLSIFALVMEHTSISKVSYSKQIRFIMNENALGVGSGKTSNEFKLSVPVHGRGTQKKAALGKTILPRSAKLDAQSVGQDLGSARRVAEMFDRVARRRGHMSRPQKRQTF